ncbi:unnamed protein product [Adineta ricciae]|uniref:Flavin-containing monooxygenase n=1 Tax=Adineta ricciae TaxID=249248 RepID=A0A815TNY5_ADIRI|nr:unnamed protein product [Adineta ricciae]
MKRIRVCIVGGGASGLACARVLALDEYHCEPTVFEQNPYICGQWHYDPEASSGTSGIYKNLRTNIPCMAMQFSDFPFPNDPPEAYVDAKTVEDYLIAYAEKHQLRQYICLNTTVNSIDETFTVTYTMKLNPSSKLLPRPERQLLEKTDDYAVYAEKFDAVCVANGHYSEIYLPDDIPGFHSHTFPIIHSRSYRDPEQYRNLCVIVVGASHSGVDICGELISSSKQVILSMKEQNTDHFNLALDLLRQSGKPICTDYLSTKFCIVPPIERIDQDTVYFENQASIKPDLIIFATGYEYRMPFLQGKLQIDQTRLLENHYVYPLYKQLFHAKFPDGTLSFLVIPYRIVPFPLAELQSHVVARVLCGLISLPSSEQMIAYIDSLTLPQNRLYHCVHGVEYARDFLEMMKDSDRHFNYRFSVDDQRRTRQEIQ